MHSCQPDTIVRIRTYEEKIHHLADQMISIDLDDGVKKNYAILDSVSPIFNRSMIAYHETGDLFVDTCEIVESAQSIAYAAVDTILVQRTWLIGNRTAMEYLDENGKADYGKKTMKKLSAELKDKYGKGFDFSKELSAGFHTAEAKGIWKKYTES